MNGLSAIAREAMCLNYRLKAPREKARLPRGNAATICETLPAGPGKLNVEFEAVTDHLIRPAFEAVCDASLPGNQTAYRAPRELCGKNFKVSSAAPRRL